MSEQHEEEDEIYPDAQSNEDTLSNNEQEEKLEEWDHDDHSEDMIEDEQDDALS